MHSQLLSDGGEPHRASGARFFKVGLALSAGVGFLVGAIVAVSLFADTSTAESSSLVALPISHHAKSPFYGMGMTQFQQSNDYVGSTVHRVRAELEDRYAKPPNDPFYGVGAKQVRQSNAYAGRLSLPTALPSFPELEDRYAKGPNDAFTAMGMGLEKPSAPFPLAGRDVAPADAGLPALPTALPSWPEREDRYAKGPNDAFTGMGMGLEKPSVPFPLEGRDGMGNQQFQQRETSAGLPPVPTALPKSQYASLSTAYGVPVRSKEGQESTIEFESLRV